MSGRVILWFAVVGAIVAAVLSGVMWVAQPGAGSGPGVALHSAICAVPVILIAAVVMFLAILIGCANYWKDR